MCHTPRVKLWCEREFREINRRIEGDIREKQKKDKEYLREEED